MDQLTCAFCMARPATGTAVEPEDTFSHPSCGTPGCGVFYKKAA